MDHYRNEQPPEETPFYTQCERWRSFLMTNSPAYRELCAERERGWNSSALSAWYSHRRVGRTTSLAQSAPCQASNHAAAQDVQSAPTRPCASASASAQTDTPKIVHAEGSTRPSSTTTTIDATPKVLPACDTVFDTSDVHALSDRYRAHMRSTVVPVAPHLFVMHKNSSRSIHEDTPASASASATVSSASPSPTVFRSNRLCMGGRMRSDAAQHVMTASRAAERPNDSLSCPSNPVSDSDSPRPSTAAPTFLDLGCAPGGVSKFLVMDLHWRGVGVTLSRAQAGIDVDSALRSHALAPYFTLLEGNVLASPNTWRCSPPRPPSPCELLAHKPCSSHAPSLSGAQIACEKSTCLNGHARENDSDMHVTHRPPHDAVVSPRVNGTPREESSNMEHTHAVDETSSENGCAGECTGNEANGDTVVNRTAHKKFFFVNGGAVQDYGQRRLTTAEESAGHATNTATADEEGVSEARKRARVSLQVSDKRATMSRTRTPAHVDCNGHDTGCHHVKDMHRDDAVTRTTADDDDASYADGEVILPWFTLFAPQLQLALDHVMDGGAMMLVYGAPHCASFFILLSALDAFVGSPQSTTCEKANASNSSNHQHEAAAAAVMTSEGGATASRHTLQAWIDRKKGSSPVTRRVRIVETMHTAKSPVYVIWQHVHTSGRTEAQRRLIDSLQANSTTLSPMAAPNASEKAAEESALTKRTAQERLLAKRQFWLGESDEGFARACEGFARHRADIESIWVRATRFLRARRERAERALTAGNSD